MGWLTKHVYTEKYPLEKLKAFPRDSENENVREYIIRYFDVYCISIINELTVQRVCVLKINDGALFCQKRDGFRKAISTPGETGLTKKTPHYEYKHRVQSLTSLLREIRQTSE